jgi:hypothetical protein
LWACKGTKYFWDVQGNGCKKKFRFLAKMMAILANILAEKRKKYAVFGKKWRKYLQIWLFCCTFAAKIIIKRQK